MTTPRFLESALWYAARRWRVLPLHSPLLPFGGKPATCSCGKSDCPSIGKHPRTANGVKDATWGEKAIRAWWNRWTFANVGIATGAASGFWVLDVDVRHGGDDTLRDLEEKHGKLPETTTSITGSRGTHFLFRLAPGQAIPNSAGKLGPGLDVRGDGGFIVGAPSIHANGNAYAWELAHRPEDVPPVLAPAWLVDMAVAGAKDKSPSPPLPTVIPEGERRSRLLSLAGTLRRRGAEESEILDALRAMNRPPRFPIPLPDGEVVELAKDVATRYPAGTPARAITPSPAGSPSTEAEPILLRADSIEAKPLSWTWPGWIPSGKLACWIGDPGLGKSMVTLDLAARITRGSPWPDGSGSAPLGSVIVLSAEDDPSDTLKPRLMAAEADLTRVHFLTMVRKPDGKQASFTLADLGPLEKALRTVGDVKLLIIDPVTCFLAGRDSYVNAQIRELLAPLAELAARFSVAVVFVTHRPKGTTTKAVYSASGSLAFTAAARAAALVALDRDDPERRLLAMVKSNLAAMPGTLAYRIATRDLEGLGGVPHVAWDEGTVHLTADEILAAESKDGKESHEEKRDRAEDFIRGTLSGGRVHSLEVITKGATEGLGEKAVRGAFRRLGGIDRRIGYGGVVYWELPGADGATAPGTSHTSLTSPTSTWGNNGKYEADTGQEGGVL